MQEAADTHTAGDPRTGNEAGQPQAHGSTPGEAPSTCTPDASPAASPAPPPSLLERLSPAPLNLSALTCGCHSPRQLKRWIDSYLQQNSMEDKAQRNAGTLRSLLTELTRWNAPAGKRLASLEALRPVVVAHCRHLIHPLFVQALETPAAAHTQEQRRDLLTGVILFQHLALAYTSICVQLAATADAAPLKPFERRRLAIALQRGIDSYRRLIFTSHVFFLASPKGSWARMQRLLQLAREQQLAERRVFDPLTDTRDGGFRWGRIVYTYLQTALFASANPMQLTAGEQRQLWQCCRQWATRAALLDRPGSGAHALLASLKLDQPPIPAVRLQRSKVDLKHFSTPLGWSIDLTDPLAQLQRRLARPGDLSTDLLRRVQAIWAGEKSRGGLRTPVNMRCQVVVGISAICHHLKRGNEPAPEIDATFTAGAGSDPLRKDLVMDVDTVDFRSGKTLASYEVSSSLLPSAPSVSRKTGPCQRYLPVPATLLNTSSSGAGLRLPPSAQGRLRCGELVALWIKDRWEVALIRWHYALPDQCRVGVEFFGGHTSAVLVHRYTREGRRTDPMAGLLTGDTGLPPELVLPIPLFQTGDTVDIVSAGQTRTVTLHAQSAATGSLAIFEFS